MVNLSDVFGIRISVPTHTYVDRQGLDGRFGYFLTTDRHIVIYGASKQGKTSLRRKKLPEELCLVVPCKPDYKVEYLYTEIRRQLGVEDVTQRKSGGNLTGKILAIAKGEAGIPLFAKSEAGGSVEGGGQKNWETTSPDYSLSWSPR